MAAAVIEGALVMSALMTGAFASAFGIWSLAVIERWRRRRAERVES